MPQFSPPNVADRSPVYVTWPDRHRPVSRLGQRLMAHYGPQTRGRSVLKTNGVYSTVDTPTEAQMAAATEVYIGGHVYEVTNDVADALRAAGYGINQSVLLTENGLALLTESGLPLLTEGVVA